MTSIPYRNYKREIVGYSLVDEEDVHIVENMKWHRNKKGGYISACVDGSTTTMHQLIMSKYHTIPENHVIDHINRQPEDNRRSVNLRIVSRSTNCHNKASTGTSKYRGVFVMPKTGKYRATIVFNYKTHLLGRFDDEIEAAKIVDKATIIAHGKDATCQGVLTEEEKQDMMSKRETMTIMDLVSKKPSKTLPQGVQSRAKKYYAVCQMRILGKFDTIEEASDAYTKRKAEIEDEKNANRLEAEITRNDKNQATIALKNKKGEVVDFAIVDDDMWHDCMKYSWYRSVNGLYVQTRIGGKAIHMHHFILHKPKPGNVIDHQNQNHKDNRLSNLREISYGENNQNKNINKTDKTSTYHGVAMYNDGRPKKWYAQISKDKIKYKLGSYLTEKEAARAYNKRAIELYDRPLLNIIN